MFLACLLSFSTGFLSLGQEILWIRLFSFTNHSLPQAFAFVLAFYLIGIAIGAHIGKRFCNANYNLWQVSGIVLWLASFFDFVSPWVYASFSQTMWQTTLGALLIFLTALTKAIIFPIVHHLGAPAFGTHVGRSISKVYVSNILGATLGPIAIGMGLLAVFTTQQCFTICAGFAFLLGLICLRSYINTALLAVNSLIALSLFLFIFTLNSNLLIAMVADHEGTIRNIVETRQGIITIYDGKEKGDAIYGGNVYDGRTNLDPNINSNGINRVTIAAAVTEQPKRVLMIGLSIGTWLKLVTGFPGVEHIDVVEINPGYITAMQQYPQQYSALSDPRVNLYIDDGRRWLKNHPNNKYDLIIMNTTYHWRAYISNLLSKEFLAMLKEHMNPRAVLTYNSTMSPDVFITAKQMFPYSYLYENFIVASDHNLREMQLDPNAKLKLSKLTIDNLPLFSDQKTIDSFLNIPLSNFDRLEENAKGLDIELTVITDNNMVTEYRHGERLI